MSSKGTVNVTASIQNVYLGKMEKPFCKTEYLKFCLITLSNKRTVLWNQSWEGEIRFREKFSFKSFPALVLGFTEEDPKQMATYLVGTQKRHILP